MKRGRRDLTVEAIPVPKDYCHPPPPNDVLPRHEFTMGIVAPKGSGKTTLIANLLNFYKGYFHNIVVFSPTVKNDEKWDYVKKQDLLSDNVELKKWINELSQEQNFNEIVHPKKPGQELQGLVDPKPLRDFKIPENCFFDEYDEETLIKILDEQQLLVDTLKKYGKPKYMANRILLIFDDLVGSKLFSNRKDSVFKRLNTNHRHLSASILEVSQAYKELPKTVRTNFSCYIIFEIPNDREVSVIYEENPMYLKKNDWLEVYEHAVDGDFNFLFINYQKPKRLRMMKNFTDVLFVENDKMQRGTQYARKKYKKEEDEEDE